MANKREFKKSLEALTAALVDEMSVNYYIAKAEDRDLISSAITKVLGAMEEAKIESNKVFGKGIRDFENIKAYNEAKKQFNKEVFNNAVSKFNDAVSEALKDYNKAVPAPSKEEK